MILTLIGMWWASMSSRHRYRWLLVGMILLVVLGAFPFLRPRPRLNVMLVTFDTTRADRIGAYGYRAGLTGAFDEFARRGVLFEKAYAPAPITLPSHATMLTGLYPPEHGLRVNGAGQLPREIPFLPELCQQNGFDTGAFIAAAVLESKYGLDRGFDLYDDEIPRTPGRIGEPRRNGREVVDAAIQWLQMRTQKPFFCWVHLYDAHAPYDSRVDVYQQRFIEQPYDAGIAWEIEQFGRLLSALQDAGLDQNTLVVVVGDHGEGLDDHQEHEHGMLVYNTTLCVPLAFAGPQSHCQPGTRIPQAVSLTDLAPTLLDLLEIPTPQHLSGRSLAAALKGQPVDPRDSYAEAETPFVMNRWAPLRAVISDRWKYIHTAQPELYDLVNDPHELTNLAESDTEEAMGLRNRLDELQAGFKLATAQNVVLSEKDLANLQALGYVTGGNAADPGSQMPDAEALPDVKDFLPYLASYEKAKHLVREGPHAKEELSEAISSLQAVVQATQDFPMADLLLGDCLAQAGRMEEAEQVYSQLLARRPDFLKARLNLGRVLGTLGRFEQAAVQFRQFLEQSPDSATTCFELAQVLIQQQKFEEAEQAYREAIRLAPEFTLASLQLGRLYLKLQRPKDAQRCFENALRHDENSVDARSHLMMILAQTGQNDQAIEHGLQLIARDPKSFDARFNLGVLLIAQRKFQEGLTQLREAQRLRPTDPRPRQQIEKTEAILQGNRR